MEQALLLLVARATDRTMSDAISFEESMKGLGTKDELLIQRVVRVHWNHPHLEQVKRASQHKYGKDLVVRVKGEEKGALSGRFKTVFEVTRLSGELINLIAVFRLLT